LARVASALGEAGFARDGIEIITADEIKGLGDPIGGSGLRRLLVRMRPSSERKASEGEKR
jgi:hypothetical protein